MRHLAYGVNGCGVEELAALIEENPATWFVRGVRHPAKLFGNTLSRMESSKPGTGIPGARFGNHGALAMDSALVTAV